MKFRLLVIATLSLIISQPVLAVKSKFMPEVCPSAKAIKAAGVTHAIKQQRGSRGWVAISENSRYGTEDEWVFLIEVDDSVKNEREAVARGNEEVNALTPTIFGPIDTKDNHWGCAYFSNDGPSRGPNAFAVTPTDIDPNNMISRLRGR